MNNKLKLLLGLLLLVSTGSAQEYRKAPAIVDSSRHQFRYTNPITRDTGISMRDHFMYEKRPYPYSQTFEPWEYTPQMAYEPLYFNNGRFYIKGPTWTEQVVDY